MFSTPTRASDRRLAAPVDGPTAEQVRAVQAVAEYPCVSLLLPTTPGPRVADDDVERLQALLLQAACRLGRAERFDDHAALLERLGALAVDAAQAQSSASLALYASPSSASRIILRIGVRERVVVDASFATRDLVRSRHRVPRHVVLVLGDDRAQLLEAVDGRLVTVEDPFPVLRSSPAGGVGRRHGSRDRGARPYLSAVDRALGTFLAAAPAPLVLLGAEPVVTASRGRSRNLARLAGVVVRDHPGASPAELLALARPVLDDHLHSRQVEALELIAVRAGAGRVARGMPAAWTAAHRGRPEVLAVEDTLFYPARVSGPNGETIVAASDVEHPEVVDDAVDELIEVVLRRGGGVALVEEGTLSTSGGVALAMRQQQ